MTKLHEIQPEQVGARTGQLYEYQHHQVACATLMLIDGGSLCIYCEWHDDYVSEDANRRYSFYQVKTRTKKAGPWKIGEFFGTPKRTKRVGAASSTSHFLKMFRTWQTFRKEHAQSLLVTDNEIDQEFQQLLAAVHSTKSAQQLTGSDKTTFQFMVTSLHQADAAVTANTLFSFLKQFTIQPTLGPSDDLDTCRAILAERLTRLSEVDVLMSEARTMALSLVSLVRRKSVLKVKTPIPEDELRLSKGVTLPELLNLLSLSPEGYDELRSSGRNAVATLSRLHRLCRKLGFNETEIPLLCRIKAEWHVWWNDNKSYLNGVDELTLKTAAQVMLQAQQGATFDVLIAQAQMFANLQAKNFPTLTPLTGDLVLGMVLDLAVGAQS